MPGLVLLSCSQAAELADLLPGAAVEGNRITLNTIDLPALFLALDLAGIDLLDVKLEGKTLTPRSSVFEASRRIGLGLP